MISRVLKSNKDHIMKKDCYFPNTPIFKKFYLLSLKGYAFCRLHKNIDNYLIIFHFESLDLFAHEN